MIAPNNNLPKWKDIEGYEGIYQVNNLGEVKALERKVMRKKTGLKPIKERIIKGYIDKMGYKEVCLKANGLNKHFLIHRLIAIYFIPKVEGKNYVNHKDGNKLNNSISNLEWVTSSENNNHAYQNGLKFGKKGETHPLFNKCGFNSIKGKIVLDTQNGIFYGSAREAAKHYDLTYGSLRSQLAGINKNKTSLIYV